MPTTSISLRPDSAMARSTLRPMRPNPLIATRTAIQLLLKGSKILYLRRGLLNLFLSWQFFSLTERSLPFIITPHPPLALPRTHTPFPTPSARPPPDPQNLFQHACP